MRKLSCIAIVAMLLVLTFAVSGCDDTPPRERSADIPYLVTDGNRIIVSTTGEEIRLKGVNAGGWLVQEGWMCPTTIDATKNIEYSDKVMYETLIGRFGVEKAYELVDIYLDNWWTEADFDNVKALGFNHIRLNFTYMNFFYLPDYSLREDAFLRIDWFIENCAERGLYVILDMHGAFGSQNGQHHSGDISQAALFTDETNMLATTLLWTRIAERYRDNPWIAAYDLLNEPEGDLRSGNTDKREWDFFDRLYDAIRKVDPHHIIMMESCWEFTNLPQPTDYGWENVVYQIHVYNWAGNNISTQQFWSFKMLDLLAMQFELPLYVGEWNAFSLKEDWDYAFNFYDSQNIGWCVWSYKTHDSGNWGFYGSNGYGIADITNDSYETIADKWSHVKTNTDGRYPANQALIDIVTPHLNSQN